MKCAQDNVTLLFFPDFSPATAIRRKAFNPVLKKMTALGLQPFLIYPAVIKLRHKGEQKSFDSPQKAEDFISSLSQQQTYADALRGNSGRCFSGPAGGAFSSPLSPTGILSLYIRYNDLVAGKTDTPFFFFFWRGLMESRFN